VHVFIACFPALSGIARNGRVIDQASGEEVASILKGGRIAKNIQETSADLRQISRVNTASHRVENNSPYRFHPDDILAGSV
jgi:hypothetical protein